MLSEKKVKSPLISAMNTSRLPKYNG
uniref:Uncharacterized protein n=1 Tax=Rhizophora mucronata TaxID=61149 RepID=A0A2P2NW46_RHIMU